MKSLPHDLQIEKNLLSAILYDHNVFDEINIEADDFYSTAHQKIFRAMQGLALSNTGIDAGLLANQLRKSGEIEHVGGSVYIASLLDQPLSVNPEYYSNIIRSKSHLRYVILAARQMLADSLSETMTADEVTERAQLSIMGIGDDEKKETHISRVALARISELESAEKLRRETGKRITGISTGHPKIDDVMSGLQRSDLFILAGRPAMGKTALALNWILSMGEQGIPGAIFSIEMPEGQLVDRLVAIDTSINTMRFRSPSFSSDEWCTISDSIARISGYPIHIVDEPGVTITQISSISRRLKKKYNIQYIVIDYLQLIEGWTKEGQAAKAEISRALKKLARALDLPVIALSQLNRGLESRNNKRPMMSDLRDSGAIEQDADIVAFVYRGVVYNNQTLNPKIAEIIFAKNRHGITGRVPLSFYAEYTQFVDNVFDYNPDDE